MVVPGVVLLLHVAWGRAVGELLGKLVPAGGVAVRVTVPEGRRRRRIAGHGVAVIGAVFQGYFPVFVELLELGSPVLEPDFHLEKEGREGSVTFWVPFTYMVNTPPKGGRGDGGQMEWRVNRNVTAWADLLLCLA